MELLSGAIGYWGKGSRQCFLNLVCLKHIGQSVYLHLFTCWIDVLHLRCKGLHLLRNGMEGNLMLVICESGGVWHMCMCKRIKGRSLTLIWRSVSLLGIQRVTRVGSFTILQPRKSLFQSGQILMRGTHLRESC